MVLIFGRVYFAPNPMHIDQTTTPSQSDIFRTYMTQLLVQGGMFAFSLLSTPLVIFDLYLTYADPLNTFKDVKHGQTYLGYGVFEVIATVFAWTVLIQIPYFTALFIDNITSHEKWYSVLYYNVVLWATLGFNQAASTGLYWYSIILVPPSSNPGGG